jgi:SAM-dependent methyltransferase
MSSHTDTSPAWHAVAAAAAIGTGTAVLDVGCGTGGFCALAAGRGAVVHGLDADPGRIERARLAAPGVDFRIGFMEALPWPDDSFDVVTGFNAFQYAVDVDLALADARRVTRRGGRIAICKWAPPQHNELFALIGALCGEAAAPAADDPLDEAVRRAGLDTEATGDVPVEVALRDDAALEAALAAAGALRPSEEQRDAADACPVAGADARGLAAADARPVAAADARPAPAAGARLAAAAAPFRRADGSYRFTNRFSYRVLRA